MIAGPVTCRTLAEQGAQVLDLANPTLEVNFPVQDTHVGFRDIHESAAKGMLQQER